MGPLPGLRPARCPSSSSRPLARRTRMLGIPTEPLSGRSRSGSMRVANTAVAGGVEAIRTVSAENLSAQEIARRKSLIDLVRQDAKDLGGKLVT